MKIFALALIGLALILAGCVGQASTSPTSTPAVQASAALGTIPPEATPASTPTPEPTAISTPSIQPSVGQEAKEFTMTAKMFEFTPSVITVKKGDLVRIKITSVDVTHGFSLPDFGVNANLEPGKEVTVEFTADKVGTFSFFCSVYCGSGHGDMQGILVVTE